MGDPQLITRHIIITHDTVWAIYYHSHMKLGYQPLLPMFVHIIQRSTHLGHCKMGGSTEDHGGETFAYINNSCVSQYLGHIKIIV